MNVFQQVDSNKIGRNSSSEFFPCEICNSPINRFGKKKYGRRCSFACKSKATWKKNLLAAFIFFPFLIIPISLFQVVIFIIILDCLINAVYGIFIRINKYQRTDSTQLNESPKDFKMFRRKPEYQNNKDVESKNIKKIFVPELNKELLLCCYQTYRLDEAYCICGRAIPDVIE